jgi:hypothetical protein
MWLGWYIHWAAGRPVTSVGPGGLNFSKCPFWPVGLRTQKLRFLPKNMLVAYYVGEGRSWERKISIHCFTLGLFLHVGYRYAFAFNGILGAPVALTVQASALGKCDLNLPGTNYYSRGLS